jgi:pyocin large subunit-like protein
LSDLFQRHSSDFGAISIDDYETMADAFLGGPRDPTVLECIRTDGIIVRYNTVTNDFGAIGSDNIIRTFFKPLRGIAYYRENCTR